MTRNTNCFGDGTSARSGVYKLNTFAGYVRAGAWWQNAGQEEFLRPGTYNWVCPPGVTKVSAVCVGAGGGGYNSWANPAGGGGGLGWKNNISVTPGQAYTVVVGNRGQRSTSNGGDSYFIGSGTVQGFGGKLNGQPGTYTGDGGGNGGSASHSGGGGAGGYSGQGGDTQTNAPAISGGGAGGYQYSSTHGTGAGGGVGIYGRRTDYTAKAGAAFGKQGGTKGSTIEVWNGGNHGGLGGQGGSRRTGTISGEMTGYSGCNGENPWGFGYNANAIQGGFPGGGGGGPGTSNGGGDGGDGAVRIMWAGETSHTTRAYPDTDCEDVS